MPADEPLESFETAFVDAANTASQPPAAAPPATPAPPAPPAAPLPTPPPAATAAPQPAAPPAPAVGPGTTAQSPLSPWAQAAADAGLPVTGMSDEQIALAMRDFIVQNRPYTTYGRQLAPYASQVEQYLAAQDQPPQPAAPAEPTEEAWDEGKYFAEKWAAPKWDEAYTMALQQGWVVRNNETGLYEAAPGAEGLVMHMLPTMNQAASWTAQQWQGITRGNPYRQFYDTLLEPMRHQWQSDIQRLISQELERHETAQRVNSFEAANASWLFQVDPQTGYRTLTPQGQVFYDEIETLQEAGVSDPQRLITLAMRAVSRPQSPVAPQSDAQAVPPAPPLPASAASPQVTSANLQTTFLQNALQRAAHSPQAGGYVQPAPDHPVNVDENDLNSMFISEFRAARNAGPR